MAIPKYDEITLPLLRIIADGKEYARQELPALIGEHFKLSEEERSRKLPSGQSTYLKNRTGWAGFHLRKAGLVEIPREGYQRITDAGRQFLATNPDKITRRILMQLEPFRVYMMQLRKQRGSDETEAESPTIQTEEEDELTPEEMMESSSALLRSQLASELLLKVKQGTSTFFEQLVVDLLLKMGYGGSRAEAGRATRQTADNGIDGVIDEDRLGLDAVYVQAKKWENTVGEPELRDFVGALHIKRASKGVFMTTSEFSAPARRYVEMVNFKISLIDGQRLAELMIDFGVGVSMVQTYEIKKIDSDYFEEG